MTHQTDESTDRREYTHIVATWFWSASLGFDYRFLEIANWTGYCTACKDIVERLLPATVGRGAL